MKSLDIFDHQSFEPIILQIFLIYLEIISLIIFLENLKRKKMIITNKQN